jgi:hypothetical protein
MLDHLRARGEPCHGAIEKNRRSWFQETISEFRDKDLVGTLVPDAKMIKHNPPIKKDAAQGRVTEEDRKVRVSAFLYAASREKRREE